MARNVKAVALIVAGAVLVAIPEPVTTFIGVGLLAKGLKMLRSTTLRSKENEDIELGEEAEEPPEHWLSVFTKYQHYTQNKFFLYN